MTRYSLSLLGSNLSALEETRDWCELQVRHPDKLLRAVFPELEVLVNNAGIFSRVGFQEVTTEDIDECMEVNLKPQV